MDDIFSGKKILVTGATGLIGGGVAQALLKQGCQIRAMVRNSERAAPLAHQGFEVVLGDMADSPALERAVAGCQVVLHFASALGDEFASPAYIHKVIVDGTLKLAEVALTVGVERFVHTSTSWVYGYKAGPGATEQSPYTFSHDPYIDSKIEAEQGLLQMYRAQGLPLVIVQPSIVYGPGDRHWTVKPLRFIRARSMMLVEDGKGMIQPIYVDDVVAGVLVAARNGRCGEAYLIVGPEAMSLRRYYGEYARMLGRKSIPSIPRWLAMALGSTLEGISAITHHPPMFSRPIVRCNLMQVSYDGSKARRELGFTPQVGLEVGMRRVEDWLKREKPLGKDGL